MIHRIHKVWTFRPVFDTPDGELGRGWAWVDDSQLKKYVNTKLIFDPSARRPRDRIRVVPAGTSLYGVPSLKECSAINFDTGLADPRWADNALPGDRVQVVGFEYYEGIIEVDFGAGDLLKGQYAPGMDDPDGRWVRYLAKGSRIVDDQRNPGRTFKHREHRAMQAERISRHGPPRADLVKVASPVNERFVKRVLEEDEWRARALGAGDQRPADCRVID